MDLVAERSRAAEVARRQQGQAAVARLKEARKTLKRAVQKVNKKGIVPKSRAARWAEEALASVRALSSGDSRATAVAMQTLLDDGSIECVTPKESADAATKHFTKVKIFMRER